MKELCIVITTDYTDPGHVEYAKETKEDLDTIRRTLEKTHDIREFKLNLKSGSMQINKVVGQILAESEGYAGCKIVINSHGSRISLDMPCLIILQTVELISIPVRQLCFLTCSAMSAPKHKDFVQDMLASGKTTALYHIAEGAKPHPKPEPSQAERLRVRLQNLSSSITQSFSIWGPLRGYSPTEDTELVQNILNQIDNDLISTLDVNITPKELVGTLSIENIKRAIQHIESPSQAIDDKDRNTIGDLTTYLYQKLTQSIDEHLRYMPKESFSSIDKENMPHEVLYLYEVLNASGQGKIGDRKALDSIFNDWRKKHKPQGRLELLKAFIASIEIPSAHLNGASGGRNGEIEKSKSLIGANRQVLFGGGGDEQIKKTEKTEKKESESNPMKKQ